MTAILFRSVLTSSVQMAIPLAAVLLLVPMGRKYIRPHTLFSVEKLMVVGMLLTLGFTVLGPFIQIPVSEEIPVPQIPPLLSVPPEQLLALSGGIGEGTLATVTTHSHSVSIWSIGGILWSLGAAGLFLFTLVQNALFFWHIRKNSSPISPALSKVYTACSHVIGSAVTPVVRISSEISSPMAAGYFHPVIFLPMKALFFTKEEQLLLLSHELYHCKAKDNFWRLLSSIVLSVYWFDPLVWLLSRSFCTQCELCCDENVLSGASSKTRKLYGQLLLALSAKKLDYSQPMLPLQSGWRDTFRSLKLRIGEIISLKHKRPGKIFLSGCALILLLFSGMVGFSQGHPYSPSAVVILPDDPMGYTEEGTPAARETHLIQPPIATNQVLHFTLTNADGSTRCTRLHFMARTKNEAVSAGCSGVVVSVQTKKRSEVKDNAIPKPLGKYVIVDCGNGISIRYTYLDTVLVDVGQTVSPGDILGTAGHTGVSYGDDDQCGVFVMQDGLMIDPLPFFDIPVHPAA